MARTDSRRRMLPSTTGLFGRQGYLATGPTSASESLSVPLRQTRRETGPRKQIRRDVPPPQTVATHLRTTVEREYF
ncbi:hypothetical protein ATK36_4171 [Amycolatopsis sulphurea]|uniref:Uncharacterized protein n=1 Tax=Amycolatopsis sulphurea TaxID=76022 RepID=A0A2A9FEW7_9PSEU|nr:hypothetical protein [Amycolatopsis sulphurea]PFG49050.1 hypothetical protein ATK36_4171 [Amycolatopsis sulphurea]